jgi:hypothetical protein
VPQFTTLQRGTKNGHLNNLVKNEDLLAVHSSTQSKAPPLNSLQERSGAWRQGLPQFNHHLARIHAAMTAAHNPMRQHYGNQAT